MFGAGMLVAGTIQNLAEEQKIEAQYRKKMEAEAKNSADGMIPKRFVIKSSSNNKYLCYISYDDNNSFDGLLQFTSEKIISPYTKFEFEYSNVEGCYHIRCCYNNRYVVRRDDKSSYIVATAPEPVKDPSDWRCTLFKPIYDSNRKAHRLRHHQLAHDVYIYNSSEAPSIPNAANPGKANESQAFYTIVDWDSIYVLPKYVGFKGDNGKYLVLGMTGVVVFGGHTKDKSIAYEIIPANDGSIHVRSVERGAIWTRSRRNWIAGKHIDANSKDPNTLFSPFKVRDNFVALRNLGNNRFCVRATRGEYTDCLNADPTFLTSTAHLKVEELVTSRVIDNVEYKLHDATIYGQKVLSMAKGDAINKTKETDTVTFKFYYEKKVKTNWSSTLSSKVGFTTKFQINGVPIIGGAKIEISGEVGSKYSWGQTDKHKDIIELTYPVTVPPMSRVEINVVVKHGMCKVPFSYRRADVLYDGRRVVNRLNDGLFTGFNSYDYEFISKAVPMESAKG